MEATVFLILLINLLALAGLGLFVFWTLQKHLPRQGGEEQKQMVRGLVNEVFGEVSGKVATQSKLILQGEKETISADLRNKHAAIEKLVDELRHEMQGRQRDLHVSEEKRSAQFAQLSESIKQQQEITKELKENTAQLKNVLANNQTRGQWGERILDELLLSGGLVEGYHYAKQIPLGSESIKPDITLLLPNQRKVAVDAKFPYSAMQKMAEETTKEGKLAARKQFVVDVKEKVNQIVKRGYINPEQGTLDYAILFVPNEILFSYINQTAPEVIDYALEKHVMIVSPFTFLIVARTIMESYRNFMMENHLRDIVRHIGEFVEEWGRFENEFGKFDESLSKLRKNYDQIVTTRYKQMNMRLGRIEKFRLGQSEGGAAATPPPPLPILDSSDPA